MYIVFFFFFTNRFTINQDHSHSFEYECFVRISVKTDTFTANNPFDDNRKDTSYRFPIDIRYNSLK